MNTEYTPGQLVKTIYGDVGTVCCHVGLLVTIVQEFKDGSCKMLGDFHPTKILVA